jgi:hypothetical protein
MNPLEIIEGVCWLNLSVNRDHRGSLLALGHEQSLPFMIRRTHCIFGCSPDDVRGEHSSNCREAISAITGDVTIDVDNGLEQTTIRLDKPGRMIVIESGVWVRLREFKPQTVLVVAADLDYSKTKTHGSPRYHRLNHGLRLFNGDAAAA